MKLRFAAGLGCFCLFMNVVASDESNWGIGSRTVPIPAGASPELQNAIIDSAIPDVIAAAATIPANDEEWLVRIEGSDTASAERLRSQIEVLDIKVERTRIAGVAVRWVTPTKIAPENQDRLFIELHGGAYVYGNGDAGLGEALLVADRLSIPVLSIDYRMPPKNPFPAAVDDVVAVYKHLLETRSPKSMAIGGTSAGGGLALASIHRFNALDLPLPGAVFAGTAWADLTKTGDTEFTNEGLDRILVTYDGTLGAAAKLYADGHDMRDPLLSPVYGSFDHFPPTIFVTGTRDMFLSDVARTHRKLRAAGIAADLHVYEGMSHAGYLINPGTPESIDAYKEVSRFFGTHLE